MSRSSLFAVVVVALCAFGCQAPPPGHVVYVAPQVGLTGSADVVRADDQAVAIDVATMLAELEPAVRAALPGTRGRRLEVWVQDELSLFRGETAGHDVDGFHVVDTGRIHLRVEERERMRATLAHELVHALVDDTWRRLPPVVEEGLADWVATQVCADVAARIRAGRLGDAGGSLGGLSMRLRLASPTSAARSALPSRILLTSDAPLQLDDVFAAEVVGLDALRASTDVRPGLYGCGFLLVDRIVARHGIGHLRALCLVAERDGEPVVPSDALLDAARLDHSRRAWSVAAARALSDADVSEMGRRHARTLAAALAALPGGRDAASSGRAFLEHFGAEWGPLWGDARVRLADVTEVAVALDAAWPR